MDTTEVKGKAQDLAGKVQETAGQMMGDTATQVAGKARQAAGSVQSATGGALDMARDFTSDQPMTALLIAAGIGFLLGALARG